MSSFLDPIINEVINDNIDAPLLITEDGNFRGLKNIELYCKIKKKWIEEER